MEIIYLGSVCFIYMATGLYSHKEMYNTDTHIHTQQKRSVSIERTERELKSSCYRNRVLVCEVDVPVDSFQSLSESCPGVFLQISEDLHSEIP